MFTKNEIHEVRSLTIFRWLLMATSAGILNAVAFIGLGTFATHITGFATLVGINIAELHIEGFLAAVIVPLCFLFGTIISGLCIEGRIKQNKVPYYDYVMYSCTILILLACMIGNFHAFHQIHHTHLENNFLMLSMICLTSGLINAAISNSSSSTIRTTHLTGTTTDLGRSIAAMISVKAQNIPIDKAELRINVLRALTILFFITGSIVGAILYPIIHFNTLIIPAIYFAYAGYEGQKQRRTK